MNCYQTHSFSPAMLSQWVEEMEKLLVARQNNISARMGNHQDIRSQQTAMQIAQAARMHAANQKQAGFHYHNRSGQEEDVLLGDC